MTKMDDLGIPPFSGNFQIKHNGTNQEYQQFILNKEMVSENLISQCRYSVLCEWIAPQENSDDPNWNTNEPTDRFIFRTQHYSTF